MLHIDKWIKQKFEENYQPNFTPKEVDGIYHNTIHNVRQWKLWYNRRDNIQ